MRTIGLEILSRKLWRWILWRVEMALQEWINNLNETRDDNLIAGLLVERFVAWLLWRGDSKDQTIQLEKWAVLVSYKSKTGKVRVLTWYRSTIIASLLVSSAHQPPHIHLTLSFLFQLYDLSYPLLHYSHTSGGQSYILKRYTCGIACRRFMPVRDHSYDCC